MDPLIIIIAVVSVLVFNILFAGWVFRDSKKRGMNAKLWGALVFLAPELILVYMLIARNRNQHGLY
jgi:uncharacterized membrane protein